jgi:glutamine---fructose-6-phosphate transaminase (isomerizing)
MSDHSRDWHTGDYPELRDQPPWVMEEMILAQPSLVQPILGAPGASVATLRAAIAAAGQAGAPIVVTGCGTSEHAALAVAELISAALRADNAGSRAEARQALDAALDPRPGGVCIGISHDGATRATQLALEAARAAGATTAVVTARAGAPIAAAADHVVVTPINDASWCHTLAYASALLAGSALAAEPTATTIDRAHAAVETTLALRHELEESVSRLHPGRIVTAGLGIDHIAARELALKIEEGARIPATAHHLETLLHGHLAGCDAATTNLVLLGADPRPGARRDHRLALAARASDAIGIPTIAIAPAAVLAALPDTVERIEIAPPDRPASLVVALLQSAVALQLLTLGLVHAAGTNPDLIRREQAPYRAAAQIADATSDW